MTIRPAGMTGAACAAITALLLVSAFLVSMSAPAGAQLSLTPAAQSAPKAKIATKAAVAATSERTRKAPNRMPHWNTYTMGNADLAFLSATQYVDLSVYDDAIWVVGENEFSLLDFAAGNVRIVDSDELTEIDLANEPAVLLAQASAGGDAKEAKPVYQVASAQPVPDKSEEDDGILNRILMTFAGALAVAGAMKMLFA